MKFSLKLTQLNLHVYFFLIKKYHDALVKLIFGLFLWKSKNNLSI